MPSPANFPKESEAERLEAERRRQVILADEAKISDDPSLAAELNISNKKVAGEISPFNTRDPQYRPPAFAGIDPASDSSGVDLSSANTSSGSTPSSPASETVTSKTGSFNLGPNSSIFNDFLTQATGALQAGVEGAKLGAASIGEMTDKIQSSILDLGTTLAEVAKGSNSFLMKKEADNAAIKGTFGLDINAADNIISSGASEAQSLAAQHSIALDKYSKLNEVSFFDNPLNWLSAQLSLPQAAAQVNNLSAKHLSVVNKTADAIQLSTSAIQNTNLAAATTNQDQAEKLAKAEILKSVEAASKVGLISEEAKIKLLATIAPLQSEAAKLIISGVSLDINYSQKLYQNWIKGIQLDEKVKQDAEKQSQIDDAKLALTRANTVLGTDYTFGQVKGMPAANRELLGRIGSLGSLGQTIPEVLQNQKYIGMTPQTAGVKKMLERVETEYATQVRVLEQSLPDKKLAAETAGFTLQRTFKVYSEDVSAGNDNPYKGGAPGAILVNNPSLQAQIPMLMKVMEPILGQSQPLDANVIADLAVKAASMNAKGEVTIPNAKVLTQLSGEMETYFKAVVENNNKTFRYSTLALPAQEAYKSRVTGILGPSVVVDYSNKAQNMSILLQKSVKQLQQYEEIQRSQELNKNMVTP